LNLAKNFRLNTDMSRALELKCKGGQNKTKLFNKVSKNRRKSCKKRGGLKGMQKERRAHRLLVNQPI
jgi:hypothetical protein